jgi:hypothetical protein
MGGSTFWNGTKSYIPSELHYFLTAMKHPPTDFASTQVAAAGFGMFRRSLPRSLPAPSSLAAVQRAAPWFEWLSERVTVVFGHTAYDGKIVHITLQTKQPVFYVLLSYRADGESTWTSEIIRATIKGTAARPFDGTPGLSWPGPDDAMAPGRPSSELYALLQRGQEVHTPDLWSRPLDELVVAIGPAPHLYVAVTHFDGDRAWIEDDGGSILVKDRARPAQHGDYRGDDQGRYERTWLSKDKVIPMLRSAISWAPTDTWRRRNAAVLHARWGRFKSVETWFKDELLFAYDFGDAHDLLKFNRFLLVAPVQAGWLDRPSRPTFRKRCARAEAIAYQHMDLPLMSGSAPDQLGDDDDDDEEDVAEAERLNFAAFPAAYTLAWGRLDGISGIVPRTAITVEHNGAAVEDVRSIDYPVPDDSFHQIANSGLLNSAQLSSLYSSVGTRAHLVLGFTPLLGTEGGREIDTDDVLFVQASHVRAVDKSCPYDRVPDGTANGAVELKPAFHSFVFDAFYVNFVRGALAKVSGSLWLVEYPVFHPTLLVGRSGILKRPQTFLDAVYSNSDGTLTLVDYKTLMQARPPNGRLLNQKNLRQLVTNAAYFQAMTKMRVKRASLVYITRVGTVTTVTIDLNACSHITKAALLKPLARATHFISHTATHVGVQTQIRDATLDELGASTGEARGEAVVLPAPLPADSSSSDDDDDDDGDDGDDDASAESSAPGDDESFSDEDVGTGIVAGSEPMYALPPSGVVDRASRQLDSGFAAATRALRTDIAERIGDGCQLMFDSLELLQRLRLRGRAQALFEHMAASLFPPEVTADNVVVDVVEPAALNQPRRYRGVVGSPDIVQVLVRTAHRLLNKEVLDAFGHIRETRSTARVAADVTVENFLEHVLHHSRRDLWSAEAVQFASTRVEHVLDTVKSKLLEFLSR